MQHASIPFALAFGPQGCMAEVKGRVVAVWRHAELPRLFWGLTFLSLSLITRELYQEIVAQGYTGSLRTLEKIVVQLRPHRAKLITKQTITFQKAPSPRNAALMIVRPQKSRTADQTMFIDQLCKSDPTAATVYTLAQAFGSLLRNREGKRGLEQWKGAVRASGIPELIDFMEGLADDAEAVVNACSESWNNGMTEGFVNKVKWIKRSSYGQAGFPLLQRRVLLHPTTKETRRKTKMRST